MIVRCVKTNEKREELKLHKKYIVYGLHFEDMEVNYLLDPLDDGYPFFYDSKYFDIIDNFVPTSWVLSKRELVIIYSYNEIASDFGKYYYLLSDKDPWYLENFMQRKKEIDKEVVQNRLKNGIELKLKAINGFQTLGKVSNFKLNFENELVKININIDNKTRYEYLKNSGQSWCYIKLDDGKFEAMTSVDRLNFVLKRAIKFIETT